MRGEELYLNGEKVDMTTQDVTFTMKSNLLGEFGRIVAGSSQTIRLPRTTKNMRILDFPEVVSRSGKMVRRKLKAVLLKNGVPMIEDGEAVVLSSTKEGYEIGITYGVVSFLSAVKDGGNLNELTDEGESVEWSQTSVQDYPLNGGNGYGFAEYDNGLNDVTKGNVTPCVHLPWIIGKIEKRFNFRFDGLDGLNGKYVLLTDRRMNREAANGIIAEYNTTKADRYSWGSGQTTRSVGLVVMTSIVLPAYNVEVKRSLFIFNQKASRARINISMSGYGNGTETLYLLKNTNDPLEGYLAMANKDSFGDWVIDVEVENLAQGDYLQFVMSEYRDSTIVGGVQLSATYEWAEGEEPKEMEYPSASYPIVANLPKVKVAEFIQLCGVLTGRFPMVQKGEKDVLRMVSVEDLMANKRLAVDWSDKWSGEADTIEYKYLGGMKNFIRWEADEDVEKSGVPTEGYVAVDDDTLDVWNDLIKLPLGASDGGRIPQYSYVDGKLTENDVQPRVLALNAETNEVAYTEALWPQTLINSVLAGYQELVRKPIVLKGTFRLSELDIRWLDYLKPVYLRQCGKYYGVVQVQYKGDESTVELLQLPL